jgi:hypothetical protein
VSNPDVREIGTVTCVHGSVLRVGVDYDAVTINGVQLGPEARDDFARLYFAADEAAKAWAVANPDDEDEAVDRATVPGQAVPGA